MQLVTDGPDIPDALLQAHEEGRVVFFCGAGISSPAGLPRFKELVEEIYWFLGRERSDSRLETAAFKRGEFDETLHLLEKNLPGGPTVVRRALAQVLKTNVSLERATDTHVALLQLARDRDNKLRLVTTNFDRLFHEAAKRTGQIFPEHSAPMLPIPKKSRWNGLVYLHGLLPDATEKDDETAHELLENLVITRGDFASAYINDGWAANFVRKLFREYVVCFVGYSIDDRMLYNMMAGFEKDRMQGEDLPRAWVLAGCEPGQEDRETEHWESKDVTPIFYDSRDDHSALHKTLQAWGRSHHDGVRGKESIVVEYAPTLPAESTAQDNFFEQIPWVLLDAFGKPAKQVAAFDSVPSLEWLMDAFTDERYQHSDLPRFGVPPREKVDPKLRFSLINRPAPYHLAPRMRLVSGGNTDPQLDKVMEQLARWLLRHLNDPRLVIWIAQQGGQLHDRWARMIQMELDRFARLAQEGKDTELEDIRANAPNAIPSPPMRTLWGLLLSGRAISSPRQDLYRWRERLKRDGLTLALRLELRELLAPKVTLAAPFRWGEESEQTDEPLRLRQLVGWELVLTTDDPHSVFKGLKDNSLWNTALPLLLEDLQQLLRDALDLMRELSEDNNNPSDRSYWYLPSISPHWQNRYFHDWVVLIELLRDAWLQIHATTSTPARAAEIALGWFRLPYLAFKRLALFAASQDGCLAPDQWVDWLLTDDGWWLWAPDTRREICRLLVLQGHRLEQPAKERLEEAILAGPPREKFRDNLESDEWQDLAEKSIWLRLAKLEASELKLGAVATKRLQELSQAHLDWGFDEFHQREEFSGWMSGTGDPDYDENREINIAPRTRGELVKWLKKPIPQRAYPRYEDDWRDVCRTDFSVSLDALSDLAQAGEWPAERWRDALQVWSDEGLVLRSWHHTAQLVQTMSDEVLQEIVDSLTWWLKEVSKSIDQHEDILLGLCQRVLDLPLEPDSGDDPVNKAINHPVGHVTEALIHLWFKRKPTDNDQLPDDIKPLFTQICDVQIDRFRHGRVILGSRLIALFRVDRQWTEKYLLPLLNWTANPEEAKALWQGFLSSPRLYQPLLIAFKTQFLATASHYDDLGDAYGRQFVAILTYAALDTVDGYIREDFKSVISALGEKGLAESARALVASLEGAADQREEYWENRIKPFLKLWPQSHDVVTTSIAQSFARLIIASGDKFSKALSAVKAKGWLCELDYLYDLLPRLNESKLCKKFPEAALELLNDIIGEGSIQESADELQKGLDDIKEAKPELEYDSRFQNLARQIG
jgi:hypothetical protein